MANILIVSGHPDLAHDSVANVTIRQALQEKLPEAEFDDLGMLYPDYQFDVVSEQQKLERVDIIVFQYPVFWYHFPALLQKWMEDVFLRGFSHGSTGDKLKGKKVVASLTTGAPAAFYEGAEAGFPLQTLLAPLEGACNLTQMKLVGQVLTGDVSYASRNDAVAKASMVERARAHASQLAELVRSI